MVVIVAANSKGGVGKTSAAVHLGVGLGLAGQRVLLVDLDPGGHATTWLLGDKAERGIAEAMMVGRLDAGHLVELPARPGVVLAPCSSALEGVEAALSRQFAKEQVLASVLATADGVFDTVVIDCPPSTGFLTQSAIHAATDVICPVTAGYMGIAGVVDIRALLKQVRERSKSRARMLGCLLFAADEREGVTEYTRQQLGPSAFLSTEVRVSTAAKRLPAQRATAWDPGADARGQEDYTALVRETRRRLKAVV